MRSFALSVFAAVLFGVSRPAEAPCRALMCSCATARGQALPLSVLVQKQREHAERVILGQVARVDTLAPERMFGAGGDIEAIRQIVARVLVQRVWRGPLTDTVTVRFSTVEWPSSCDIALQRGQRYLIFAVRMPSGYLITRQCSGTVEARIAEPTIAVLGESQAPRP